MKSKRLVLLRASSLSLLGIFVFLLASSSLHGANRYRRNIFYSATYDNTSDFSQRIGLITDVNQKDKEGNPLLFSTMQLVDKGRNYDKMVILLNKGADIEARNKSGQTPLIAAVRIEAENMVRELLKRGAKAEVFDKENMGPLAYAIRKDLLPIVKLLLEAKFNPNHAAMKIKYGRQSVLPIKLATQMRNPRILKLLLAHGAKYDLSKDGLLDLTENCNNETFLVRDGRLACIEFLLRRSKPQALRKEWLESVAVNKLLLKYKMNTDSKVLSKDFPGLCSYSGKLEVIAFFLSKYKLPQEALDSALHRAVLTYRLEVVRLLLVAGAKADRPLYTKTQITKITDK
jgi:Ankyrin repeats (3 copies)